MKLRHFGWISAHCVALLAFQLGSPSAIAGLIPIDFSDQPVIAAGSGSLQYDSVNQQLTAAVTPLAYVGASAELGTFDLAESTLTLELAVDAQGELTALGGSLLLSGQLDVDGDGTTDASGTLLEGTISELGVEPSGGPPWAFNAFYDVDGGALTGLLTLSGGGTVQGGFRPDRIGALIVFANNLADGVLGDFSAGFGSSSVTANVGLLIPEPATGTLAVLTLALVALAVRTTFAASRGGARHG
jgi:hypothetical protein